MTENEGERVRLVGGPPDGWAVLHSRQERWVRLRATMRQEYAAGASYADLAKRYDLCVGVVWHVVRTKDEPPLAPEDEHD